MRHIIQRKREIEGKSEHVIRSETSLQLQLFNYSRNETEMQNKIRCQKILAIATSSYQDSKKWNYKWNDNVFKQVYHSQ